jgi:prevent-host-death family protein
MRLCSSDPTSENRVTRTISSRDFNQDAGGAKKAAAEGPVVITDRGRPAHVLLTYEAYLALLGPRRSLLDVVSQKEDDDIEFDPPRMGDAIFLTPHLD